MLSPTNEFLPVLESKIKKLLSILFFKADRWPNTWRK